MGDINTVSLYRDRALQSLADGLIGTWHWDIGKDIVYADTTLAKFFSVPEADAISGLPIERFISLIHPDDRDMVSCEIKGAIKNRKDYEVECRIVSKSGRNRWVIARGKVSLDDSGRVADLPGVMVDITDRKIAEIKQAETEKRLNFMADSMPHLVWIADGNGKVECHNKRWYEYTGVKPGETEGDGWRKVLHTDDQSKADVAWKESLSTGRPYEIQYRLYYASNRTYRWVISRAMPFKNDKGEITKWYGTCTDIDEQKHAVLVQTFLAKASKRLASSLNYVRTLKAVTELSVPDVADWCSVDLVDDEGNLEQVAVSHTDPEKISQAIEYRQAYPVEVGASQGLGKVIRTGKTEFHPYIDSDMIKSTVKNKKNQKFMLSLNLRSIIITPIIDRKDVVGAITFVLSDSERYYNHGDVRMAEKIASRVALAIANAKLYESSLKEIQARKKLENDLTLEQQKLETRVVERTRQLNATNQGLVEEIKRRQLAEKELKAYSEELSRSNQELQDFAYVASHDLQEPLRKIQAFGDLLQTEYGDKLGGGKDYLDRMLNASSRMSNLIHDLLSFSRVSTQASPSLEVNLNAIVADVLIDLETAIDDKKAKITVGELPAVCADPTHMRQLFQNLISNALKFNQENTPPVIDISSSNYGRDHIEIRIKDNGVGFDGKYNEKIFSVFQRLHGREAYSGTGIGLAVCRKIVQRYGGTITAESSIGKGSTFIIQLPKDLRKVDSND